MSLTNAEARDKYLPGIRREFRDFLLFRNFTNRNFEGDAQNAQSLRLTNVTTNYTVDATSGRDVAMPAHEGSDFVEDVLNIDQRAAHSAYEAAMDTLEGPSGYLPTVLRDQARALAEKVDDNIRDYILASVPDANDAEATAGLRLGSDADFVPDTGEPSTEAARKLFPSLIRQVNHLYRARNYWKTGEDQFRPLIVVPNALWTGMLAYIDLDRPSDPMVDQYTRSDGVRVGGIAGVWKDIPIVVTNRLPKFNAGGKAYLSVLVTNPMAVTAAFRPPTMGVDQGFVLVEEPAGTFKRKNGWTSDVEARYGRVKVNNNDGLLFRFGVRNSA